MAAMLIVEDSDEDFAAIVRALERAGAAVDVMRATDGDDALERLHESSGTPAPAVVLLDLNLPGTDGREVLDEVKATERLRQVPIVVFSASSNPKTIAECYRRGASGYLVKPFDIGRLENLIAALKQYWLDAVTLPPAEEDRAQA